MPRPDLVGITAFTSQAPRAYEIAARVRRLGVPVVMGGIHATMCVDEVMPRVDAVVTGEADAVWPQVLEDAAARPPEAPVRRRPRRDGRGPAGPPRPADRRLRLRGDSDDPRLSHELHVLQRHGLQRRPLPPALHPGGRARVPVDPREAGPGGGRQPDRHHTRAHRARQGPVPRAGRRGPRQGMDRAGHDQLRRRRGTADVGRASRVARACSSGSSRRRRRG